jgi:P27 family predicted phage terminase small subunit
MGARGPIGKPNELKLLEGGRGHRPLDLTSAFRPEVGLPSMPKHLTPLGRKAWKRLTPELVRYNLLSIVDRDALAMLCQTIGRIEMVETSLAATQSLLASRGEDPAAALLSSTPNGMEVQHPLYQVLNRETEKARNLLAEFGLTPAQRARVSTAIRAQASLHGVNTSDGRPGAAAEPARPAGFSGFD